MASALDLPPISTSILADVEQAAVDLGVTRDQMTEAAARAAAALARKLLDNQVAGASVVALAGGGVKSCVALPPMPGSTWPETASKASRISSASRRRRFIRPTSKERGFTPAARTLRREVIVTTS